jgi:HEAT repeat protein
MKISIPIISVTLLASTAFAAPPAPTGIDRRAVEKNLNGIEYIPSASALKSFGANVDTVLRDIVSDTAKPSLARNRAITLLRFFPSKKTEALLLQVIERTRKAKGPALIDLQQAVASYTTLAKDRALPMLRSLLDHKNIDVRYRVARSFGAIRTTESKAILQQQLKRERSTTVIAALNKSIVQLDKTPKK